MNESAPAPRVVYVDRKKKLDEGDAILAGFLLLVITLYGLAIRFDLDWCGRLATRLLMIFVVSVLALWVVAGIKGCNAKSATPVNVERSAL